MKPVLPMIRKPYEGRDPRFYQSIVYPTGQIKYLDVETGTVKERLYDPEDPTTVPEHQYNYSLSLRLPDICGTNTLTTLSMP